MSHSITGTNKVFRTRYIYNSHVQPANVEAALACRHKRDSNTKKVLVKSKNFRASTGSIDGIDDSKSQNNCLNKVEEVENTGNKLENVNMMSSGVENASECTEGVHQVGVSSILVRVNTDTHNEFAAASHTREQTCLLYDRRVNGIEDKFINSISHYTGSKWAFVGQNSPIFSQWQKQSEFSFGFIPHSEQVMPDVVNIVSPVGLSVFDIHALVRATGKHNYMSARIPVRYQLNVSTWKEELNNYWDQQLLQLFEFGFPLDFNRQCPLRFEGKNHTSATDHPADIDAYIQ